MNYGFWSDLGAGVVRYTHVWTAKAAQYPSMRIPQHEDLYADLWGRTGVWVKVWRRDAAEVDQGDVRFF